MMLSERKDLRIHGNSSPNECSSHCATNMSISTLIRQVGWVRATCSILRVPHCLDKAVVWLRAMRKPPTVSVPVRRFTDKQSSICNSTSPTPSLPKQKWKAQKKPHRTKKRPLIWQIFSKPNHLGFPAQYRHWDQTHLSAISVSATPIMPALHNHNQTVCCALCNILKSWRNM